MLQANKIGYRSELKVRVKSHFFYLDPRELRAYLFFFTLLLDSELYDTNTKWSVYHFGAC